MYTKEYATKLRNIATIMPNRIEVFKYADKV